MAVNKITLEEREILRNKSAQSLPNVPSVHNWTPQQFKNAITKCLFDNKDSFFAYINRLVDGILEDVLLKENESMKYLGEFSTKIDFAKEAFKMFENEQKVFYAKCSNNISICLCSNDSALVLDKTSITNINRENVDAPVLIPKLTALKIETPLLDASSGEIIIKEATRDYHPTQKKYVDSKIEETVGDINSILDALNGEVV